MVGRGGHRRGALAVTVVVALLVGVASLDAVPAQSADAGGATARPTGDGSGLAELEDRLLERVPDVGPTWVVDLAGESTGRRLLARSLQGLVNRSTARLYLDDPGDGGDSAVLDRYVDRGLVTVAGHTDVDGALDQFAAEAAGFVVADPAEEWSVHEAMVVASLEGGIVATPDQVADLLGRGLSELDDVRGRWPDAASAYAGLAAAYGDSLPSDTLAVVRPTDTLWDFVHQQGILPVFARPSDSTWAAVVALFADVPDGSPVYGYLSDTGEEEAIAVATLAANELTLVPTDTTRNLSFHIAVGADRQRVPMAEPHLDQVAPCDGSTLDVVLGVTDGDNMNVPLNHFMRPSNWDSTRRGDVAVGWSIGPDLAVLAPAVWDSYALEATTRDELVGMIGWGYSSPALLDDPVAFYDLTFRAMADLGMRAFWSLGGGLETPTAPYWSDLEAAASDGVPTSVLVGYGNATGSAFTSPQGRPAFTSRSVYEETPQDLVQHVTDLLATPPDERPAVSFLSATNWSNPVDDLIEVLAPFEAQGVRFLTPSEAAACLPDTGPVDPDPDPEAPQECLPVGPIEERGLPLISAPAAAEIASRPTALDVPFAVAAPSTAAPGDLIDYRAVATVDLAAFAGRVLEERVRPIIAAGYGPELAESAWLELQFDDLVAEVGLPDHVSVVGDPAVSGDGPLPEAHRVGDGLEVAFPPLSADTRAAQSPFDVAISWTATVGETPVPVDAEVTRQGLAFDLALDIGVVLGAVPLTGGVTASWVCEPTPEVLATTSIVPTATAELPDGNGPAAMVEPPGSIEHPTTSPAAPATRAMPSFTG